MTIQQAIAYYIGVAISCTVIFLILRAVCLVVLEKRRKKVFLMGHADASLQEIDNDFKKYFKPIKTKLYIPLVIIVILLYIMIKA